MQLRGRLLLRAGRGNVPPKIPKAKVEAAVKAVQLYAGSTSCRIHDSQRLFTRMHAKIDAVVKATGMDRDDAHAQIAAEARRRGPICPMPGKDI